MTETMIDNLDAQGHGGKPLVTSKESIPKPPIYRGRMGVGSEFVTKVHDNGSMDFVIRETNDPDADCLVTYHRVDPTGDRCTPGMFCVEVLPTTLVTWEWVEKA